MARAQVLRLPILGRELSCCWQDVRPRRPPAKPLPRNALGPELRCCLQAGAAAFSDPGTSGADGSAPPHRGARHDTLSNNPGCEIAISGNCRDRRRDIRDRTRSSAGGSQRDADVDSRLRRRRSEEAGTWKVEIAFDNSGSAVPPYPPLSHHVDGVAAKQALAQKSGDLFLLEIGSVGNSRLKLSSGKI